MSLTKEDVLRVAKLAKLNIPETRLPDVQRDLNSILRLVGELNQLDTRGIEPLVHAIELSDVLQPDSIRESLTRDQVLQNAPSHDGMYFKVPPVLG